MVRPVILLAAVAACSNDQFHKTVPEVDVDARVGLGNPYVGDTVHAEFGIHSIGTGRVRVTSITCTHPEIELAWDDQRADRRGTPVDPGSTLEVRVTWRPTAAGAHRDAIQVETDVEGAETWVVDTIGWARELPSCDDSNPCTSDRFDRESETCVHTNNSASCDDANACTHDDHCYEGECRGIAKTCDDDDVCTLNLCDPASGCRFPPDNVICDDGDPCTKNVCDPDDGCSYPRADNGTPCGSFDCATGHFCFFGDCREWDITSQAEGSPCSDGDRCTDGDACHDGECQPGTPIQTTPELVATIETFGGEGSIAATDGYRYLFADPDQVRLAVLDGGVLDHVASLQVLPTSAPVLWSPGKFLVASGAALAFIDATDVTAPSVVWSVTVADGTVAHLARAEGGVVFAIQSDPFTAERLIPLVEVGPYYLPIAADGTAGVVTPLDDETVVHDLDADGAHIAWVTDTGIDYMVLAPDGSTAYHLEHPEPGLQRISVNGARIAVLAGYLRVYDVVLFASIPACTNSLACEEVVPCADTPLLTNTTYPVDCVTGADDCPFGSSCQSVLVDTCPPGDPCASNCITRNVCVPAQFLSLLTLGVDANDLALKDNSIWVTGSQGTEEIIFSDNVDNGVDPPPDPDDDVAVATITQPIDPLAGTRIDRADDHVMVSGPIALPLRVVDWNEQPSPPPDEEPQLPATRVTGPRHGNVHAIVDASDTSILVAGNVAVGRINVVDEEVVSWWLTDDAARATDPRLLIGRNRDAAITPVTTWMQDSSYFPTPQCTGLEVQAVGAAGWLEPFQPCDYLGGPIAVAGSQLWAFGPLPAVADSIVTPLGMRAWSLAGGQPAWAYLPVYGTGGPEWPLAQVRAASAGGQVAAFAPIGYCGDYCDDADEAFPWSYNLHVLVVDTNAGANPILADTPLPTAVGWERPDRHLLAVEGTRVLVSQLNQLQLIDLLGLPNPIGPPTLDIAEATATDNLAIPWMAGGRAWITWQPGDDELPGGPYLTQLAYASTTMEREGDVLLPQPPESMVDAGEVALVTSRAGVHLIAPACR